MQSDQKNVNSKTPFPTFIFGKVDYSNSTAHPVHLPAYFSLQFYAFIDETAGSIFVSATIITTLAPCDTVSPGFLHTGNK